MLVENKDYYIEDGLMVLTESFLKNRGYCCKNECKHCPFGNKPSKELKISDLWIGEKLIIKSSNKIGSFEGLNAEGKLRIKCNDKVLLTSLNNVALFKEENKIDITWENENIEKINIQKSAKYPNSIDLHIEVLSPEMSKAHPSRILDYQMECFANFLKGAIKAKLARVTIIHGKGEGILMKEIHNYLERDSEVRLKSLTNRDGATEVWLK